MKKITAMLTVLILATSIVAPTVAIGSSTSQRPMSKYEAASIVMNSIKNKSYKSVIILDNQESYIEEYLKSVAEQIDNLTGYIYKIKATYDSKEYPLRLNIEVSNNIEEKDKVSTIEASAKLIAKRAKEKYKDKKSQLAYVNDTLIGLCEYDLEASNNIDEASDMAWSAYGCLTLGKAVCAGYTNAITVILEELEIPVIEVIGTSPTGVRHTWNKVYVDNSWLNIDVTSNDPIWGIEPSEADRKRVSRRYFLVSDDIMTNSGYRWNTSDVEICKDIKYPDLVEVEQNLVKALGIMTGTDKGMEPGKELTRSELAIILVRLEGKSKLVEQNKEQYKSKCLFEDVADWAKPYVGYCVDNGLLHGLEKGNYGGNQYVSKRDLATILLRTLRIADNTYNWENSVNKAVELGVVSPGRDINVRNEIAYRSDIIDSIAKAIDIKINGNTSIRNRVISDR